jgi:hypothetical protein
MQMRMEDRVRRKTRKALKLSAHHAGMALQMLIEEGKIAAGDVAKALKRREKMIKNLRARLAELESASRPAARKLTAAGRKAITRAQKTARQAQGRYMAAVRRLSEEARAKIREIRKQSGVDAAIKAARKMAP